MRAIKIEILQALSTNSREHQSKPQAMKSAEMCQCAFEINPQKPTSVSFYRTH